MTTSRPVPALDLASFDSLLHAAGADFWPEKEERRYMRREQRQANRRLAGAVPWVLSYVTGRPVGWSYTIGLGLMFFSLFLGRLVEPVMSIPLALGGAVVLLQGLFAYRWLTVDANPIRGTMPERALQLIRDIRALTLTSTDFEVSWLGKDPILRCRRRHPLTGTPEKRVMLIWDEQGNIVPPPA